ncbi:hypothetical protein [Stenotrophomonas maltophilia]|uniref:hypothetical protein n=1 Tax=Stenotrophomonas maltophilia group TaxID=995085 RepID=UPI0007090FC8|nr:hypothetical protein [Stenotrophomonas maltophilia]VEE52102.1 Uncharacterised protein [Stenotrophomonas maltophilia]
MMDNFFDQFDQPAQPAAPKLARGQLQPGNIDLNNRPVVRNPDGSISTVRSISANFDGQEVLIPTVSEDGRVLSDDDAIAQYQRTGRNLGIFDTPDNATAYAQSLHRDQEQQYVPQVDGGNFFDQFDGGATPATLGENPLRHADGRLTEAGWQAERDALAAARQKEVEGTSFWGNLIAGYGRSLPNLVQGAKQAYVDSVAGLSGTAADVLGNFGGQTLGDARRSAAGYFGDLSRDLRQETNQERIASQALTDSWGGILGGGLGDVINTAPLLPVGVAARSAGVTKAVGQAALGGSLQGAVQPVAKEGERLDNTVLGGVLGGGFSALGRGAMTLGENVMPQNVTARALNFFNERANAKPFAAEGEALAQRTGIDLTPAMVSGSKSQTAMENMARQSVFSADTAFEADEKIANQAIANINRIMDRVSPDTASAQGIGQRVQESVDKAVKSVVDRREEMAKQQYGAIRRMVGDAPVVDYSKTRQVLQDIIGENTDVLGADARRVRTQAQRMLDELGAKDGFSLDSARKSRSSYGAAARGQANLLSNVDRNVNKSFAKRMYAAISDDIEAAGQRLDEAAGFGQNGMVPAGTNVTRPSEMLKAANDEYRNHTDLLRKIEQSPLRRLLGDKIDVDGFTSYSLPPETVVQRIDAMKPSELAQVRYFMEKNEPEVWGQYKRMIVEDALGAAQTAPASVGANHVPFNAGGFIRAIGGDNPQKTGRLQQIFNPNEMAEIRDAMEAARRMGDSFGKNFSGTGPYNEVMQASNGFIDAFKNASVRAAAGTAAPIAGFNKVARMMVDSNGRKALIELSRLPPGTRRANDLAAYLAATATVGSDEPLDIEIVGGKREGAPAQE